MATIQTASVKGVPLDGPQLAILDTNAVFNDLIYQLRRGREEGYLVRLAREGAIRLFAATHVLEEVQSKAASQERRGFSAEELLALFERRYLPHIRFVDPGVGVPESRVSAVADPDDRPTARLALLLAPCHVLTDDQHLTSAGFGRPRSLAGLATSVDRTKQLDQLVVLCVELTKQAGRRWWPRLRAQVRDTRPLEVGLGIGLGFALLALMPASGHARLNQVVSGGGKLLTEAGITTVSLGREWAGERAQYSKYLNEVAVQPSQPLTPEQRIARMLAVEGSSTAAVIGARIALDVPAVETILGSNTAFVNDGQLWSLGRRARSPRTEAP